MSRRWADDERGEGVADGRAFAPGADELVAALRQEKWVAEEPELHLLPHIERACAVSRFQLRAVSRAADGAFDVKLDWAGDGGSIGAIREAVFALVGSFAESATYVRQRRAEGQALQFEVATGTLGDGAFAPHGHTLRLTIEP
jgi:hypothetical protein